MKNSKNVFRKLILLGIGLCTACCLLPIFAAMFGWGVLTVLAAYLDWLGIVAMALVVMSVGVYCFKKSMHQRATMIAHVKKATQL